MGHRNNLVKVEYRTEPFCAFDQTKVECVCEYVYVCVNVQLGKLLKSLLRCAEAQKKGEGRGTGVEIDDAPVRGKKKS